MYGIRGSMMMVLAVVLTRAFRIVYRRFTFLGRLYWQRAAADAQPSEEPMEMERPSMYVVDGKLALAAPEVRASNPSM